VKSAEDAERITRGAPLKIAAAQTSVSPDITANGSAVRSMIAAAAASGVRVINFCEGSLSGYSKFQMPDPDDWRSFDWHKQEAKLRAATDLCSDLRIFAVVGGAHRLAGDHPPHNSLYVFSDTGTLLTRHDKRFLSNSELDRWYSPGTAPITFDVDGYRFGCAICIESTFPEVFQEYANVGVDAVLFSSYGIAE